MFENRVLRRIFGPKREEVTGGWKQVLRPIDELDDLYSSRNIIILMKSRRIRGSRHVERMGKMETSVQNFLWRTRRSEGDLGTDWRITGYEGVDWIYLSRARIHRRDVVNIVIKLRGVQSTDNVLSG
jgi:hypothetical protein